MLLGKVPSDLAQSSEGVGRPVASQRSRRLLPSGEVSWVAEVITVGLTHWSSSTRCSRTPARFSGPLHATNMSMRTTGQSVILESAMTLERRQSQIKGLSCRPEEQRRYSQHRVPLEEIQSPQGTTRCRDVPIQYPSDIGPLHWIGYRRGERNMIRSVQRVT